MYVRACASCAEYWERMVRGVRMVRAVRWGHVALSAQKSGAASAD